MPEAFIPPTRAADPADLAAYQFTTDVCEKALRTLLARIGPWGENLVLVGGLAPRYLIPSPNEGVEPHVGTTDLDVVMSLAMTTVDPTPFEALEAILKEARFAPDPPSGNDRGSFRWTRTVDGLKVKFEVLAPQQPGEEHRTVLPVVEGRTLGALRLRGADLVARDQVLHHLTGATIDGDVVEVGLRVAGLLPFLVLKAFALNERRKAKDAYDVVWTLDAGEGGPDGAAERTLVSPVADERVVGEAFGHLGYWFPSHEGDGSQMYADFLSQRVTPQHARRARFAYRTVDRFLRGWTAGKTLVPAL